MVTIYYSILQHVDIHWYAIFEKKKSVKILKMDIFKNVQNENIRKVFILIIRDFSLSLIDAVKNKLNITICDDNIFIAISFRNF